MIDITTTTTTNSTKKQEIRALDRLGTAVVCTQITLLLYRYLLNRDESRRSLTCRERTGISRNVPLLILP